MIVLLRSLALLQTAASLRLSIHPLCFLPAFEKNRPRFPNSTKICHFTSRISFHLDNPQSGMLVPRMTDTRRNELITPGLSTPSLINIQGTRQRCIAFVLIAPCSLRLTIIVGTHPIRTNHHSCDDNTLSDLAQMDSNWRLDLI